MQESCVVLADTHQNILESIRGLLESVFTSVVMVADQRSLFDALDRIQPKLAIVDLSLSGYGDFKTTHKLSTSFPGIGIIVLSDYDEPEVVDAVMSAGALGFILKPYAGTELFDAITNVQKGQIYISPMVKRNDTTNGMK